MKISNEVLLAVYFVLIGAVLVFTVLTLSLVLHNQAIYTGQEFVCNYSNQLPNLSMFPLRG